MERAIKWFEIEQVEDMVSPALLVYPDRIKSNIEKMIAMAGGVKRLRPHVKTHKMAEIITLQMNLGIHKFKCATIAEAELLAKCGAQDVLLAMQPVGVHVSRLFELITIYQETRFSTLVDNVKSMIDMAAHAERRKQAIAVWLDINNGMDRTGICLGEKAKALYRTMAANPHISIQGLHVYDGHIHESDARLRKAKCNHDFEPVLQFIGDLAADGIEVHTTVAGGTPTFPIHLERENIEVSPGTPLLWDDGYANLFPDLKFQFAATLLTRVVSKPGPELICLDLGHKSVASEMSMPRVKLLDERHSEQISQSEEHLVVWVEDEEKYEIGEVIYALPVHICPTVSKYEHVLTVLDGDVTGMWKVAARDHV